jgi:DNA topoisomerase-1
MPPKYYKKKTYGNSKISSANISTAKYLLIVESPSKCSKIETYLGKDYCCIASKGHIRCLKGLKSVDTKNNFQPTFEFIDEKKGHIEEMKKMIARFSKEDILLATDDDREGEAIAWHICEVFGLCINTTKRIIFHEVTKPALIKAVNEPILLNMRLIKAQHARQVLDVIVGYKVSPFLWKYLYNNKENSLSAGRCQTPALRLVYENEQMKSKCNEKDVLFKTNGYFFTANKKFQLNKDYKDENELHTFLEESKSFKHVLDVGKERSGSRNPPKPFHTSRLLQTASNVMNASPKETMDLCQQLYQNGYITYMRTESNQYSKPFLESIGKYIEENYGKGSRTTEIERLENNNESNPHEAIRVTQISVKSISADNSRMATLYRIIWKNTIESCMSDYIFKGYSITITAPKENKYSYTLEIPVQLGWKKVDATKTTTVLQEDPASEKLFFESQKGNIIPYNCVESNCSIGSRHSHYSEASLINKLEELGIGRPSTFASIVETIKERGYVKKGDIVGEKMETNKYVLRRNEVIISKEEKEYGNEKNKLTIETIGILSLEFLLEHFSSMFSYEYTKNMEEKLDSISRGDIRDWETICRDSYNQIKDLSKPIKNISKQSYTLDNNHDLVFEKYGPVVREKGEGDIKRYYNVKKDIHIDILHLKEGKYKWEEIIEEDDHCIGVHEEIAIYIKNGRYGLYLEWGEKKKSVKGVIDEMKKMDKQAALDILLAEETPEKNVLRKLTNTLSVRKGKYGPYVYYKTDKMKSPKFLNIKKFKGNYFECEINELVNWLIETYEIE